MLDPTESINGIDCNINSRETVTECNNNQKITLPPPTTERNQQQRQSQRSISPTHRRADESEDDDFLDEIIPGKTMPNLPPLKNNIETAQRT
ncbi:MAG: hypothetical protein EZS28_051037 [Streblomastix strix]|uniref:Uncharacterized protein n=1 Tax=Streblomastix strix TaxID=222440 RepID=A0A5J4T5E2_9EUKA|nr:MAG: hypothetical protein EZS28_051037 [Streblomastix strix]